MSNQQELLQKVLDARKKVNELEGFLTDAKEVKSEFEGKLIEQMDDAEVKSFKSTAHNCVVVRKEKLYVSVDKEKKEEAFRWVEEDCGRADMIKPQIHNRTLSSFISQRLKDGENIPQHLFIWFCKPELSITLKK